MSDISANKRSYTVPVLFIIIVILTTLIIIFCSKYLLSNQEHTTDQGRQLTEEYNYALIFADRLHDGAELMLNAKSEADRIRAAILLGEASLASGETVDLFIEAAHLQSGQTIEETGPRLRLAMEVVISSDNLMANIGEHEGPLTDAETSALTHIRDGAAQMQQALNGFRPPSGEAGFRQMVTIGAWIANAEEASRSLEQLAAQINPS